jgi:predicted RNase H-like HicB family nuclease
MATYTVYIQTDKETIAREGGYLAHLPDFPGCVARGRTRRETLERLRDNLSAYLSLLRQSGESHIPDKDEPIEFDVKEVHQRVLPSDYMPLMTCERDRLLQWMSVLWDELMEVVTSLPKEAIVWKPNPVYPSIADVLREAAETQWHLVQRLEPCPDDLIDCLTMMRQRVRTRISSLSQKEQSRVTRHCGEDWTARRVIREIMEATRHTLREVQSLKDLYAREHRV